MNPRYKTGSDRISSLSWRNDNRKALERSKLDFWKSTYAVAKVFESLPGGSFTSTPSKAMPLNPLRWEPANWIAWTSAREMQKYLENEQYQVAEENVTYDIPEFVFTQDDWVALRTPTSARVVMYSPSESRWFVDFWPDGSLFAAGKLLMEIADMQNVDIKVYSD